MGAGGLKPPYPKNSIGESKKEEEEERRESRKKKREREE